ncbi:MAG: hypothetical protein AVDCRST_MAG13-2805, partial [uncultured Solirubrobacteraceae bacterium]
AAPGGWEQGRHARPRHPDRLDRPARRHPRLQRRRPPGGHRQARARGHGHGHLRRDHPRHGARAPLRRRAGGRPARRGGGTAHDPRGRGPRAARAHAGARRHRRRSHGPRREPAAVQAPPGLGPALRPLL